MSKYLEHDVQAETDGFNKLPIKKVGVRKIKMPISVKVKGSDNPFQTVAHISAYCNLVAEKKGINMSRNSRVLIKELSSEQIHLDTLDKLVQRLAEAHETDSIHLKIWFEYIYESESPVTKIKSYEPCIVSAEVDYDNGVVQTFLQVKTNESSCCPCSKNMSMLKNNLTDAEISRISSELDLGLYSKIMKAGYGAHNQRSEIDIKVQLNHCDKQNLMWIEDLVDVAKRASSAPTCNVLKREDEKFVTENQYFNPKFCEDIARDAAALLNEELDKRILDYVVVVNNEESIHTTLLATAVIDANRKLN